MNGESNKTVNNKIILWTSGVDNLVSELNNNHRIGGIQVQMYMWGVTLIQNHWTVYSFTNNLKNNKKVYDGIRFIYFPYIKYITPLLSPLFTLYYAARIHPDMILLYGATRSLLFVNLVSRLFRVKILEMFASDSDLEPGKELIAGRLDRILFRSGIKITSNFIVQNLKQLELLKVNYNKADPLIIPNIWTGRTTNELQEPIKDIVLWVSNFRKLKRPEWFLRLAIDRPSYKFVMVGNNTDKELFENCKQQALEIPNLEFMGGLSFTKTEVLFRRAYLFICTSEIEGFPNTFLQAWMNKCPVISTFDPSGLIQKLKLGFYCENYEDVCKGFDLLIDEEFQKTIKSNIDAFYKNTFSAQMHYERLKDRFCL